jgi:probable HAF family extracellular repeat protein
MKQRALTALVFVLAQIAGAQEYKITDLGPLTPVAINLWGQVAGNLNEHAYLWTETAGMHNLGLLHGGTFSSATAINDLGAVAGTADGPGTIINSENQTATCAKLTQPFVWTHAKGFTTAPSIPVVSNTLMRSGGACAQEVYANNINVLGHVVATNRFLASYMDGFLWNGARTVSFVGEDYQDSANAINISGVIVGQSLNYPTASWAVLWKNDVKTNIGALNSASKCSGANSINDLGQVVGWSAITDAPCTDPQAPVHAFLWKAGSATADLGTLPGDTSSVALKISLAGKVVGNSGHTVTTNPVPPLIQVVGRPFVWSKPGGMRDLNQLIDPHSGWKLNSAADINIWGQIVGTGTYKGQTRGFLLTPRI